jgi:heat shock protein HtpX
VAREQASELHALVEEVATALGTRAPDLVCIDHEFNASFGVRGLRRRSVLTLGLPMWAVLDPQERVALLGHELGHGRNGDVSRGLVVGTAIDALYEIVMLGEPDVFTYVAPGTRHKASQASLRLLLLPVRLLLYLQVQLLLRDRQRAEYLADHLGAVAGGTAGGLGLQEMLLIDSVLDDEVRRAVTTGLGAGGVITSWRETLLRVPERERERRRRVARLETARLAATHPPTALRIRVLESRQAQEPRVVLDAERSAAIDAELAVFHREIEERMLDDYRATL